MTAQTQSQRVLVVGNARVTLRLIKGSMVADKTWSETRVHSSGGGGVVGRWGGYINSPSVTSRTVTWRELWLRADDGRELSIRLPNSTLGARTGHRLIACWGAKDGSSEGPYVLFVNTSTGQHEINYAGCGQLLSSRAQKFVFGLCGVALLIGFLPLAVASGKAGWWGASGAAAAAAAWIIRDSRRKLSDLLTELDKVRRELIRPT